MAMVTYRSYPKLPMDIGHFAVHLKVLAEASSKRWTTYGYVYLQVISKITYGYLTHGVHLKVLAEASSKRWTTYGYLWLCLLKVISKTTYGYWTLYISLKSLGRSKQQEVKERKKERHIRLAAFMNKFSAAANKPSQIPSSSSVVFVFGFGKRCNSFSPSSSV